MRSFLAIVKAFVLFNLDYLSQSFQVTITNDPTTISAITSSLQILKNIILIRVYEDKVFKVISF